MIKRFHTFVLEDLGIDLDEPDKGFKLISEHPFGDKILKTLEEKFGTKDTPLDLYDEGWAKFYGKTSGLGLKPDDVMFMVRDYKDTAGPDEIVDDIEVTYHIVDVLEDMVPSKKMDKENGLSYNDLQWVYRWYLNEVYDFNIQYCSNIVLTLQRYFIDHLN